MFSAQHSAKWFITTIWYLSAIGIVLLVATFGAARLLLPTAHEYTQKIEQQIYDVLGQPIKITSLDAEWRGFTPTLILKDVEIYLKDKSQIVMRFPNIRIGLDIYHSIITASLRFSNFELIATNMFVERDSSGQINITGLAINQYSESDIDHEVFRRWILAQSNLSIELRNLVYIDRSTQQGVFNVTNVILQLQNLGGRHVLQAVVKLAGGKTAQRKKELAITVESTGDLFDTSNWTGKIHSIAKSLSMDDMVNTRQLLQNRVQFTNSNHDIWIDIRDSKITKIQADMSFKDLEYFPVSLNDKKRTPLRYSALAGKFLWRQNDVRWSFNAQDLTFVTNGKRRPKTSLSVVYSRNALNTTNVSAEHVRIEDVLAVAKAFNANEGAGIMLSRVFATNLKGSVRELSLSTTLEDSPKYQGKAIIENFSGNLGDGTVLVHGLSGILQVNDNTRSLLVSSSDLNLDIPGIFENQLNLGTVNADVQWNIHDTNVGVKIEQVSILNSDVNLSGGFSLDWPLDDKPAMVDMRVEIKSAKGERVYRYLPHKILSPDTNDWLKNAFREARVTRGTAIMKGPLREFPFKNGDGEFKIKFHVANGILDYADQWPLIRDIEANVMFDSSRLLVKASRGAVLNSEIRDAVIEIPDMSAEPAKLLIDGYAFGDTQDKIDYMIASPPLQTLFGESLNLMKARGDSKLELHIDLALDDENTVGVTGALDLENNDLEIKNIGGILSETNGRIELLEKGVNANDIKTKIFGQDARIDISSESLLKEGQRDDYVLIHATSSFQAADLSKRFIPVMQDLWSGKSPVDLKIMIPLNKYDRNKRGDKGVDIILDTFFEGVEIRLPKPYNKTAQEKLHLVSKITLAENNRVRYRTRYGGRLDSVIEYNSTEDIIGDKGRIKGEVRFGSGVAVLPTEPGIRLVGTLEELHVDVWKSLLGQFELKMDDSSLPVKQIQPPRSKTKRVAWSSFVHSADVIVKRFGAWGQHAQNVHLVVKNVAKGVFAELDSKAIKGTVLVPRDLALNPIQMEFDYINLSENEGEFGGAAIDPRDIPSIQARSKSVTYRNRKFGSVELTITSLAEGIRIEKATAQTRETEISGHGKWIMVKGLPRSEFEFHVASTDLGDTMVALGYLNSIKGGNGNVNVKLAWPGGLTDANIEQLNGEVHFSLYDGQLLEYDPLGNARVLGLFSIQTLPRRLFLDFTDLVGKGLKFDSIEADVKVEDGNAYTNNFQMEGPTIGATMSGRVGLAAQDYDQLVQVRMKFSDIISFVGLLMVSPWAVIIPQLLKKQFDRASQLEYSLTGSWNNPILEPIIPIETQDEGDVGGE